MFLVSKLIFDPTQRWNNFMGRTIGFVFYTPKYWSCKDEDFYQSMYDDMLYPLSNEIMEERYQRKLAHAQCKRKHRSEKGYVYFIGPKRRYQFHYMGDINPYNSNPRWGYVHPHGLYVRWLDNGPQNPPRDDTLSDRNRELIQEHHKKRREVWALARAQMEEYAARRDKELANE